MSQQYQAGYPQQQVQDPSLLVKQQQQQQPQSAQVVKFYKSGLFGLSSAAGKLERDVPRMTAQGWRLAGTPTIVGSNIWWQKVVVAVYER